MTVDWTEFRDKEILSGRVNDALAEVIRKLESVRPRAASWVGAGKIMQVRVDSDEGLIRVPFKSSALSPFRAVTDDLVLPSRNTSGEEHLHARLTMKVFKSFKSTVDLDREVCGILGGGYEPGLHMDFIFSVYALHRGAIDGLELIQAYRKASRKAAILVLKTALREAFKDGSDAKKASLKQAAAIRRHRNALKKVIGPAILDGFPEDEISRIVQESVVEATMRG